MCSKAEEKAVIKELFDYLNSVEALPIKEEITRILEKTNTKTFKFDKELLLHLYYKGLFYKNLQIIVRKFVTTWNCIKAKANSTANV